PLFSEDKFLLLAPRWSGWGEVGQSVVLAALFLVPLLLIVGLYRFELKLVARRPAALLLLLRGLGLFILWSLAGLQPTIGHVAEAETPSRVLVAVDLSASMNLTDPQRTPAEKAALSQSLNVALDAVDGFSRKEIAGLLLAEDRLNLLGQLKSHHQLDLVGFHESLVDGSDQSLAWLLGPADKPLLSTATNLNLPLQRALQPSGKQNGKLVGMVVLTDGQHNQGPPPLQQAKEFANQGIPIFPIGLGSRQPPVDLAVLDVQSPKQ